MVLACGVLVKDKILTLDHEERNRKITTAFSKRESSQLSYRKETISLYLPRNLGYNGCFLLYKWRQDYQEFGTWKFSWKRQFKTRDPEQEKIHERKKLKKLN